MRLAEFKTRLFIFVAGRLLRWAESIELEITNGQSPPATLVDDSSNVLQGETSHQSEAVSGPPEHWERLVSSGPPQHWLDFIRDKAPQLAPLSETLKPSTQDEVEIVRKEEFKIETEANGPPASVQEIPGRRPPLPTGEVRRNANHSSARVKKSTLAVRADARRTWLNRLRFQPPVHRAESGDAFRVADIRPRDSDSFPAAGGATEEVSEFTLKQPTLSTGNTGEWSPEPGSNMTIPARQTIRSDKSPLPNSGGNTRVDARRPIIQFAGSRSPDLKRDKKIQGQQGVAKSGTHAGAKGSPINNYPDRQTGTEYEQPPIHDSENVHWESLSNDDLRQSMLDPTASETVKDSLYVDRSNGLFERSAQDPTRSHGRSKSESIEDHLVESSSAKLSSPLKDVDYVRGDLERREGIGSSAGVFHTRKMDQQAAESNDQSWIKKKTRRINEIRKVTRTRNDFTPPVSPAMANTRVSKQPSSHEPLINMVSRTEEASRQFAPLPLAEFTSTQSAVSRDNLWPILPPSPRFEFADELAAKEQETEALRRLEQEQRGTLWNV